MIKDLVSIITPCYNGEQFIARFLDSVLCQTYPKLELIVINDGSSDKTEGIIQAYQQQFAEREIELIYRYQANGGQASALNQGLKLFRGEYMTWVDSDDELMPDYVSAKVAYFKAHPQCAFCYGQVIFVKEENPEINVEISEKKVYLSENGYFESLMFDVANVCFNGYMARTSCVEKAIQEREIFDGRGGQNAQLLLPLSWYFGEPNYVEKSIYKYYIRKNSHSHSKNTIAKIIKQLYNYESILTETLRRIPDKGTDSYIEGVKKHYVKLRFGNAIDTKDAALIRRHYRELKDAGNASSHDFMLYLKYTNPLMRRVFHVE